MKNGELRKQERFRNFHQPLLSRFNVKNLMKHGSGTLQDKFYEKISPQRWTEWSKKVETTRKYVGGKQSSFNT